MERAAFVEHLAAGLPILMLAALLGAVGALAAVALLVRGRVVPALLAVSVASLPGIVGGAASALALTGIEGDPERALAGAVGNRLVAVFFALPAAVFLSVGAAFAAFRHRDPEGRRWMAGVALFLVVAAAAAPLGYGVPSGDVYYPTIRAAAYFLLGLPVAVAFLGRRGSEDDAGGAAPHAVAAASAVFAVVVGLGEASGRSLAHLFLLLAMSDIDTDLRPEYVDRALAAGVAPMIRWHCLSIGSAALLAAWGAISAVIDGRRRLPALLGIVLVALGPLLFLAGDPDAADLASLPATPESAPETDPTAPIAPPP